MSKDLYNINEIFVISIIVIVNFKICKAGIRILGGRDAVPGEFPFAVRLEEQLTEVEGSKEYFVYEQYCTGAALTPTWILTAAHCGDDGLVTLGYPKQPDENLFARYNSYFPNELGQLSPLIKMVKYPGYYMGNPNYAKYDIALVQTKYIKVSRYGKVSGIDYTSFVGHEAVVLGFGGINASQEHKPLQVLKGILLKCKTDKHKVVAMLCLVSPCGLETTICGGDSGGPVLHSSGIVGVNSMSCGDCNKRSHILCPGEPASIISMVSPAIDWISNVIINKTFPRS